MLTSEGLIFVSQAFGLLRDPYSTGQVSNDKREQVIVLLDLGFWHLALIRYCFADLHFLDPTLP